MWRVWRRSLAWTCEPIFLVAGAGDVDVQPSGQEPRTNVLHARYQLG